MQGQHGHLSTEQKQLAFRLRAQGWRLVDIAREIGCTAPMVGLMVRDGKHRQGEPLGWGPRPGCLTIGEREQILLGIGREESLSAIARRLGRAPSTITREVEANGGRERYSACTRTSVPANRPGVPSPANCAEEDSCGRSPGVSSGFGHPRRSPGA
jgi:transposase-like protein